MCYRLLLPTAVPSNLIVFPRGSKQYFHCSLHSAGKASPNLGHFEGGAENRVLAPGPLRVYSLLPTILKGKPAHLKSSMESHVCAGAGEHVLGRGLLGGCKAWGTPAIEKLAPSDKLPEEARSCCALVSLRAAYCLCDI